MQPHYAFSATLVAGLVIGAVLTTALRAQSTPPAYVVAEVAIHDADAFARDYAPSVAGTLQPFGGRFLTSGKLTALEGNVPPRFVIIAFDSVEKAQAFEMTAAQKEINAARMKTTESLSFIVEGTPN